GKRTGKGSGRRTGKRTGTRTVGGRDWTTKITPAEATKGGLLAANAGGGASLPPSDPRSDTRAPPRNERNGRGRGAPRRGESSRGRLPSGRRRSPLPGPARPSAAPPRAGAHGRAVPRCS